MSESKTTKRRSHAMYPEILSMKRIVRELLKFDVKTQERMIWFTAESVRARRGKP